MDDHPCPVCGYGLDERAWGWEGASFHICPCCGTQFGLDDAGPGGEDDRNKAHSRLRERRVEAGMPWWSEATPMPAGWDADGQMRRAGFLGPASG